MVKKEKLIASIICCQLPLSIERMYCITIKVLIAECETATAQNQKVLDEKAIKDKNGEYVFKNDEIVFPNEKTKKEALKELNNISNLEVEVEIMTVPISTLEMCDTDKYDTPTSKEMAVLEFMIGE